MDRTWDDKLLTEQEVAGMIKMSVHWLRRKRWEGGGIPYAKMNPGRAVRYRHSDVISYVSKLVRKSTSEGEPKI